MKQVYLLLLVIFSGLIACKEEPVPIPDFSSGKRRVLVEEVTGVRCQACPKGTRELTRLEGVFGEDSLIIVSIHAAGSNFSVPYNESKYDFRFPEAQELATLLGAPDGYPTAAINRTQVNPNATSLYVEPFTSWAGVIGSQFLTSYGVDLLLENEYDPVSRHLDMKVTIGANDALPNENRLTVLITQDSIMDVQLDGTEIIPDYIHRHVLRHIITSPSGDPVTDVLTAGAVAEKNFSYTLPADFDAKHCSVVVYLHHGSMPDREVLQVVEAHVEE